MKIGVYRIYLSATLAQSDRKARLVRAFDAIPEFLYRLDQVDADLLAEHAGDEQTVRRLLRLAMTPSHIVLADADRATGPADLLADEVDLARVAFRRPIPVLGLSQSAVMDGASDARFDRIVGHCGEDIAVAIQELAEGACYRAPELSRQPSEVGVVPTEPARGERPLPISGIAEAFDKWRARRSPRS